jgi:hypothetical protein
MDYSKRGRLVIGASVRRGAEHRAGKGLSCHYQVVARDPQGNVKWVDDFDNLVVNDGLDDSLDKHLKGSGYTAAW